MTLTFKKYTFLAVCICLNIGTQAQIKAGKITYERKINLAKKYRDNLQFVTNIKEEDRIKSDIFELSFNDTLSYFGPQLSDVRERMAFASSKNEHYRRLSNTNILTIKDVYGEKVYVNDSMPIRRWQITDNERKIAGYNCRKAIWNADDSTRIYAWYSIEVMPSIGPETFGGLPGAILGLASEDGGIVYFAKSVEQTKPSIELLTPKPNKGKIYTMAELKTKMEKDYGKSSFGKSMMKEMFGYW